MATQKDLAKKFNISQVTVSRALNGAKGVKKDLRQRILAAARVMGYDLELNFAARSMRSQALGKGQTTHVLCVILAGDLDEMSFEGRLLKGINEEANSEGSEIVLVTHSVNELPLVVTRRQVDGVIRLVGDIKLAKGYAECPVPWVSILFDIPDVPLVTIDNEIAAESIGRFLASKGHRQAAYIGPDFELSQQRLSGLRKGLANAGGSIVDEATILEAFSLDGKRFVDQLIARGALEEVSVICCYNDYIAFHAIQHLREKKIDVPGDISVTGFDGASLKGFGDVELTTVTIPLEELGREAVRLLNRRIQNPAASRQRVILDTELRQGQTVTELG